MVKTTSLIASYMSGNCVPVWRSMLAPNANQFFTQEDITAVAHETMGRVRRNAERLSQRLAGMGWQPLTGQFLGGQTATPLPGQPEVERISGFALPLALSAFWQTVGYLDFVWDYRISSKAPPLFAGVDLLDLDPLFVEGPKTLTRAIEEWHDQIEEGYLAPAGPFRLDLAPDNFHKADISGGTPYGIHLPTTEADPFFAGDHFSIRFTDYLRLAFRWGGFPGLACLPQNDCVDEKVRVLTAGLEAF